MHLYLGKDFRSHMRKISVFLCKTLNPFLVLCLILKKNALSNRDKI